MNNNPEEVGTLGHLLVTVVPAVLGQEMDRESDPSFPGGRPKRSFHTTAGKGRALSSLASLAIYRMPSLFLFLTGMRFQEEDGQERIYNY